MFSESKKERESKRAGVCEYVTKICTLNTKKLLINSCKKKHRKKQKKGKPTLSITLKT